jgi:hypothetical protein
MSRKTILHPVYKQTRKNLSKVVQDTNKLKATTLKCFDGLRKKNPVCASSHLSLSTLLFHLANHKDFLLIMGINNCSNILKPT